MKNNQKQELIHELKKVSKENDVALWKRVAIELEKPTRRQRIINLSKIDRHVGNNEIAIVPGKVLGEGELTKKVTILAHSFSKKALDKIKEIGAKYYTFKVFVKENPKPKNARILG